MARRVPVRRQRVVERRRRGEIDRQVAEVRVRVGVEHDREESVIDLTAVVTELVNNAVAHGPRRPITVALAVGDDAIRGEVADQGNPAAEIPAGREAARKGALGLQVVDQLTTRWGAYKGSTHVWFELPLDAGTG